MHAWRIERSAPSAAHGFTISEFLLVVAVFAMLIGIVVVSLRGIDKESAARDCRTELRAIKAASERFKAELGIYPEEDQLLQDAGYLRVVDSPDYRVYTETRTGPPIYEPVGSRCG